MKLKRITTIAALSLGVVGLSQANASDSGMFIGVTGGYTVNHTNGGFLDDVRNVVDIKTAKIKNSSIYGFQIGYKVNKELSVYGSYERTSSNGNVNHDRFLDGGKQYMSTKDSTFASQIILLNADYAFSSLEMFKTITPFIGAGLGISINTGSGAEYTKTFTESGVVQPYGTLDSKRTISFAAQARTGLNIDIGHGFSSSIYYELNYVGKHRYHMNYSVGSNPQEDNYTLKNVLIGSLNASLKYTF